MKKWKAAACILLTALVLAACGKKPDTSESEKGYAETLFDASYVHQIDVRMAEESDHLAVIAAMKSLSVGKQLTGELAAVNEKQLEEDKVDASDLHIVDMGAALIQ